MKTICLCLNIHILPPMFYCRFFHFYQNDFSLSCPEIEEYYKRFCHGRLKSFFNLLNQQISDSKGKLKLAVSISGSTLALMHLYVPEALTLIGNLVINKQIGLLSVPYSHSLLSYVDRNSFVEETRTHENLLEKIFNYESDVLFLHSGRNCAQLIKDVTEKACRYTTVICPAGFREKGIVEKDSIIKIFEINAKLSNLLQNRVCGKGDKSIVSNATSLFSKFMKHVPSSAPAVVVYNPLYVSSESQLLADRIYSAFLKKLCKESETTFLLPAQLPEHTPFDAKNNSGPDIYLRNQLQKEAFKSLLKVQCLIRHNPPDLWEVAKDMEYLRYMCLRFAKPSCNKKYYNPYSSPYLAYISYMNVLDSFRIKLQRKSTSRAKIKSVNACITAENQIVR